MRRHEGSKVNFAVFAGVLMLAAGFRMLGADYPMLTAVYFLLGVGFEVLDAKR